MHRLQRDGSSAAVGAVFLNDDNHIVLATGSESLAVWNASDGQFVAKVAGDGNGIRQLAIATHNRLLVTCGDRGELRFWKLRPLPPSLSHPASRKDKSK